MEIIKDTKIRNKWKVNFERSGPPDEITLHGTQGGGTYNYVLSGSRKKLYKKGIALFHFLIERDGKIIEILDPDVWVYHSSSGSHDNRTIGIELVNPHPNNDDPYTNAQYESLFHLVFDILFEKFPITVIASHKRMAEKYSNKTKNCPGNFDWDRLETEFHDRKLAFTHDYKYESYWKIQ